MQVERARERDSKWQSLIGRLISRLLECIGASLQRII